MKDRLRKARDRAASSAAVHRARDGIDRARSTDQAQEIRRRIDESDRAQTARRIVQNPKVVAQTNKEEAKRIAHQVAKDLKILNRHGEVSWVRVLRRIAVPKLLFTSGLRSLSVNVAKEYSGGSASAKWAEMQRSLDEADRARLTETAGDDVSDALDIVEGLRLRGEPAKFGSYASMATEVQETAELIVAASAGRNDSYLELAETIFFIAGQAVQAHWVPVTVSLMCESMGITVAGSPVTQSPSTDHDRLVIAAVVETLNLDYRFASANSDFEGVASAETAEGAELRLLVAAWLVLALARLDAELTPGP